MCSKKNCHIGKYLKHYTCMKICIDYSAVTCDKIIDMLDTVSIKFDDKNVTC